MGRLEGRAEGGSGDTGAGPRASEGRGGGFVGGAKGGWAGDGLRGAEVSLWVGPRRGERWLHHALESATTGVWVAGKGAEPCLRC